MASRKPVIHGRDHRPVGFYGPGDPGGADPAPGVPLPIGNDLPDTILATPDLSAFWKLNEASGTVARDSGPHGYDLSVGSAAAPTWAQLSPLAPPGEQNPLFAASNAGDPTSNRLSRASYGTLTGDFTAVCWAYMIASGHPSNYYLLMHQSTSIGTTFSGWAMTVGGASAADAKKFQVFIGTGGAGDFRVVGNNALSFGTTWYMLAYVQSGATQKLYVNGLLQAATGSYTISRTSGVALGADHDVGTAFSHEGGLSYAAVFTRALTSTELLAFYNLAFTLGNNPAGDVLTSDGSGGTLWTPPKTTVYVNGA